MLQLESVFDPLQTLGAWLRSAFLGPIDSRLLLDEARDCEQIRHTILANLNRQIYRFA